MNKDFTTWSELVETIREFEEFKLGKDPRTEEEVKEDYVFLLCDAMDAANLIESQAAEIEALKGRMEKAKIQFDHIIEWADALGYFAEQGTVLAPVFRETKNVRKELGQ